MTTLDAITPPSWTLADLYTSPQDPAIEADLAAAKQQAEEFNATYKDQLTAYNVLRAIRAYERLQEILAKLATYAYLLIAENREIEAHTQFYQHIQEQLEGVSRQTLFFTLNINQLSDDALNFAFNNDADLQRYHYWIVGIRALKPYELHEKLEEAFHDRDATANDAWVRLYDETMAALRFNLDGKELTEAEILHQLSTSPEAATRKAAAEEFSRVLTDNNRLLSLITNTLAKDKSTEDRWRGFKRPVQARNLANRIDDTAVDSLVETVSNSYPDLTHRYYTLKASWFGKDQLDYWDRNAPLPQSDNSKISWPEAKELVLNAFGDFSPTIAGLAQKFFHHNWIDAAPRPGKDSGAFSHPCSTKVHPYILMNFQGANRDVLTLAHELGHGVHQMLALDQGELLADTPLTVAETASVFGEMLTFRSLLDKATTKTEKQVLLAGKIEDMLNTVVRQIAFHQFETQVHDQRKEGELSSEQLSDIWMATQTASLGPAIKLHDSYKPYWSYIPHFIHTPFYVYAYAFGDCLVNSLYGVYQSTPDGFEEKYLALLKAGGSRPWQELVEPFGLQPGDAAFWQQGLKVITGLMDELESL